MTPQSVSPADKDNPGPEQSYYRAHRKNAEFSPDEAWSLAIDGDSDEQRGYSALRSLDELHAYISSRKYPDLTDSVARGERIVIRFTGERGRPRRGRGAASRPLYLRSRNHRCRPSQPPDGSEEPAARKDHLRCHRLDSAGQRDRSAVRPAAPYLARPRRRRAPERRPHRPGRHGISRPHRREHDQRTMPERN